MISKKRFMICSVSMILGLSSSVAMAADTIPLWGFKSNDQIKDHLVLEIEKDLGLKVDKGSVEVTNTYNPFKIGAMGFSRLMQGMFSLRPNKDKDHSFSTNFYKVKFKTKMGGLFARPGEFTCDLTVSRDNTGKKSYFVQVRHCEMDNNLAWFQEPKRTQKDSQILENKLNASNGSCSKDFLDTIEQLKLSSIEEFKQLSNDAEKSQISKLVRRTNDYTTSCMENGGSPKAKATGQVTNRISSSGAN